MCQRKQSAVLKGDAQKVQEVLANQESSQPRIPDFNLNLALNLTIYLAVFVALFAAQTCTCGQIVALSSCPISWICGASLVSFSSCADYTMHGKRKLAPLHVGTPPFVVSSASEEEPAAMRTPSESMTTPPSSPDSKTSDTSGSTSSSSSSSTRSASSSGTQAAGEHFTAIPTTQGHHKTFKEQGGANRKPNPRPNRQPKWQSRHQ